MTFCSPPNCFHCYVAPPSLLFLSLPLFSPPSPHSPPPALSLPLLLLPSLSFSFSLSLSLSLSLFLSLSLNKIHFWGGMLMSESWRRSGMGWRQHMQSTWLVVGVQVKGGGAGWEDGGGAPTST